MALNSEEYPVVPNVEDPSLDVDEEGMLTPLQTEIDLHDLDRSPVLANDGEALASYSSVPVEPNGNVSGVNDSDRGSLHEPLRAPNGVGRCEPQPPSHAPQNHIETPGTGHRRFRLRARAASSPGLRIAVHHHADGTLEAPFLLTNPFQVPAVSKGSSTKTTTAAALMQQLYIKVLFGLPNLYFTRVAKVFEDARVSSREVKQIAMSERFAENKSGAPGSRPSVVMTPPNWTLQTLPEDLVPRSSALKTFKESWEAFTNSLLREWKTMNLVSALLLTAILTLFQLPSVNMDPVSGNTSVLSLVCALMSLSCGCVYIIRFGSLGSVSRGLSWVYEAEQSKSSIWWNVWVFLSIPFVWLAWSMLWFIFTILVFVWRSDAGGLAPRIVITAHFVLGLVYFVLIVRKLQRYGKLEERMVHANEDGAELGEDGAELGEVRGGQAMTRPESGLGLTIITSAQSNV